MSGFFVLLVGVLLGYAICRWIVAAQPRLAGWLRLSSPTAVQFAALPGDVRPAVDPAKMPDTLTPEDVEAGAAQKLPDAELKRLVEVLSVWNPKKHQYEANFHRSFARFLVNNGYAEGDIEHEPRIAWRAAEHGEERHAKPDFVIRNRVLVEIKRNITVSGDSDRSLGQMLRYLIAWAGRGPAILVVCNAYDDNLRAMVQRHVRSWKAQGVPVMAYFVRSDSTSDAMSDLPS